MCDETFNSCLSPQADFISTPSGSSRYPCIERLPSEATYQMGYKRPTKRRTCSGCGQNFSERYYLKHVKSCKKYRGLSSESHSDGEDLHTNKQFCPNSIRKEEIMRMISESDSESQDEYLWAAVRFYVVPAVKKKLDIPVTADHDSSQNSSESEHSSSHEQDPTNDEMVSDSSTSDNNTDNVSDTAIGELLQFTLECFKTLAVDDTISMKQLAV